MGLLRLTVKTKNDQAAFAGTVLFNSAYMRGLQTTGSTDSFFFYMNDKNDKVFDKYVVDEAIASADNIFDAIEKTFYTLPVHDDVSNSSSATTTKVIDPETIIKGIEFSSDDSKSLLWIQEGGKTVKILVNQFLKAIYDYVMTGTTTTYE
jgi:hypothetical protein